MSLRWFTSALHYNEGVTFCHVQMFPSSVSTTATRQLHQASHYSVCSAELLKSMFLLFCGLWIFHPASLFRLCFAFIFLQPSALHCPVSASAHSTQPGGLTLVPGKARWCLATIRTKHLHRAPYICHRMPQGMKPSGCYYRAVSYQQWL